MPTSTTEIRDAFCSKNEERIEALQNTASEFAVSTKVVEDVLLVCALASIPWRTEYQNQNLQELTQELAVLGILHPPEN